MQYSQLEQWFDLNPHSSLLHFRNPFHSASPELEAVFSLPHSLNIPHNRPHSRLSHEWGSSVVELPSLPATTISLTVNLVIGKLQDFISWLVLQHLLDFWLQSKYKTISQYPTEQNIHYELRTQQRKFSPCDTCRSMEKRLILAPFVCLPKPNPTSGVLRWSG